MLLLSPKPALLIIDVQEGFDDPKWGCRNNTDAETNMFRLLSLWRSYQFPVFHIQHLSSEVDSPLRFDKPGCTIKDIVKPAPNELIIQTRVNSAFIGTQLEHLLRTDGVTTLIIVGLTTDHCVSTTTRMAGNLGFKVYTISDATATFDRQGPDGTWYSAADVHELSLVSLHHEFAIITDTESILSTVHNGSQSASG